MLLVIPLDRQNLLLDLLVGLHRLMHQYPKLCQSPDHHKRNLGLHKAMRSVDQIWQRLPYNPTRLAICQTTQAISFCSQEPLPWVPWDWLRRHLNQFFEDNDLYPPPRQSNRRQKHEGLMCKQNDMDGECIMANSWILQVACTALLFQARLQNLVSSWNVWKCFPTSPLRQYVTFRD